MNKVRALFALILFSFLNFQPALAMTFKVGISEPYAPYILKSDPNMHYGFDISFMDMLCKVLDVKCVYKEMLFDQLLSAIEKEEIDLAISAITITDYRQKKVQFTLPYAVSNGRYAIHKDNFNEKLNVDNDYLKNKRIGVTSGTIYHWYINTLDIPGIKVLSYGNDFDQISALLNKKIDILVTDNQSALWWQGKTSNMIRVIGHDFSVGNGLGIAVSKKNIQYLDRINQAIMAIKNSTDYQTLKIEYLVLPTKLIKKVNDKAKSDKEKIGTHNEM